MLYSLRALLVGIVLLLFAVYEFDIKGPVIDVAFNPLTDKLFTTCKPLIETLELKVALLEINKFKNSPDVAVIFETRVLDTMVSAVKFSAYKLTNSPPVD